MFPIAEQNLNLRDLPAVESNQRGQLADTQRAWLVALSSPASLLRFLAPLVIVLPVLCFVFSVPMTSSPTMLVPFLAIMVLVLASVIFQNGGMALRTWQTWSKLKQDLAQPVIRQAQGQLLFQAGEYLVQEMERNLTIPPSKNNGGLLPGVSYTLFYLEKSGLIISAEEAYQVNPNQVCAALTSALAGANNFTLEDLAANHNGEIAPGQRTKPLAQLFLGAVVVLLSVAVGLFSFYLFDQGKVSDPAALLVPAVVLGILLIFGAVMSLRALLDMLQASPAEVEGAGYKEMRISGGKNRTRRYYYVVNNVSFQVSRGAYGALLHGLNYRIYYLPNSKRILSMEAVSLL